MTSIPLRNVENHLAIDSSGFSVSRFEQWLNIRTMENSKKRLWKKAHLCIGTQTQIITSVEVTEGVSPDCPEFVNLFEQASANFEIRAVSADKAYLSRENFDKVAEYGGIPYIPFKSNSIGKQKGSVVWSRMFDLFIKNREAFDAGYHQRSKIETAFSSIKRKFNNNLKTKKEMSQTNEILMKCLCHNLCVLVQESLELGIDLDLDYCAKIILAQNPD